MKKLEDFTIVQFTGESKNGLTNGKLYAVETGAHQVMPEVYGDFGTPTVWDDDGELHEIDKDDFAIHSSGDQKDWFRAVWARNSN
jgi:hypothetical protein